LIEPQQARREGIRRRYGSCVVAGDLEAARVFHRRTPNQAALRCRTPAARAEH
jgi:hypothetical protein